ncbi:MAG: hypothetical protein KME28_20525 [Pelatocladus maniniholoensis HA4357-MV3]|uniref:Uncharacterized protein n=1 Tax=Pelatocladus maniniholoensis HA4357-MV3 TaxID=1117104 RepID=A0A9E3HAH7_9NOST|nr:hypothetical protein [Pelatocladus maniniholoensis HA4357-MV3]
MHKIAAFSTILSPSSDAIIPYFIALTFPYFGEILLLFYWIFKQIHGERYQLRQTFVYPAKWEVR